MILKSGVPWQVLGRTEDVVLQFAEFRSNPVYIKVRFVPPHRVCWPSVQVYVMWLSLLFNSVIPFITLLYLNAAIYNRLVSVGRDI